MSRMVQERPLDHPAPVDVRRIPPDRLPQEHFIRYYQDKLNRLHENDKVAINRLTELAIEYKNFAEIIVSLITERIFKAPKETLLPHLYVIDSICKNIRDSEYPDLFERSIIKIFEYIFRYSNEKVRSSMYKARNTWTPSRGQAGLFVSSLHQLDVEVNKLDRAWPIQAPSSVSNKILINPKKINPAITNSIRQEDLRRSSERRQEEENRRREQEASRNSEEQGRRAQEIEDETRKMREELLRKEKELLELKKKQAEADIEIERNKREKERTKKSQSSSSPPSSSNSTTKQQTKPEQSKGSSSTSSESRDPRRNRRKHEDSKSSHRSSDKSSNHKTSPKKSSKDKDKKSSSSSSHKSSSTKSRDRDRSHSGGSSSSKKSSSTKSEDKKETSEKRDTSKSPKISRTPSPVAPPKDSAAGKSSDEKTPQQNKERKRTPPPAKPNFGKIPKLPKKDVVNEEKSNSGQKRPLEEEKTERKNSNSPPPEKRPKPLLVDIDDRSGGGVSDEHLSPVVAGWAKHKESNPDQFRTPIKEHEAFFPDQQQMWHGGGHPGGFGGRGGWQGHRGFRYRDRGGRGMRMGFFGPRGRGWGPRPNFVRGGPPIHHRAPGPDMMASLPRLEELEDPEQAKKAIPKLAEVAKSSLASGMITIEQFEEFMKQLKNIEETLSHSPAHQNEPDNLEIIDVTPASNFGDHGQAKQRSQHKNDLPMADQQELENIAKDRSVSLEIDGKASEIRYYGFTATITKEDNRLYEISFKNEIEPRRIIIDKHVQVMCHVGDPKWIEFQLDGKLHRIKIGGPTRELFIDNEHHNFYFGSSGEIKIGGRKHRLELPGNPPQVQIGPLRDDLCLGKVDGSINSPNGYEKNFSLYLDKKPQLLIIGFKPHVCQFVADDYSTLLINRHPFKTNFGGFPMVISVSGNKHYVRLHALPQGVILGAVNNIPQLMQPVQQQPVAEVPPHPRINGSDFFPQQGPSNAIPPLMASTPQPPPHLLEPPRPMEVQIPAPAEPLPTMEASPPPPAAAEPDVNELWNNLQRSGVFAMFTSPTNGGSEIPGLEPSAAPAKLPAQFLVPPPGYAEQQQKEQQEQAAAGSRAAARIRKSSIGVKEILLKSHDPSLKERQQCVVDTLYGPNDLQCKSCGHRFSKDEMSTYSSHLDWHFRAKRRERDNARKAQSRRWYYEKAEWIMSDEIEDEELDLSEEEVILEQSMEVPTVRVGTAESADTIGHDTCPVCLEQFNQVYKQQGEEEEEGAWHLHNAMRDPDGVAYHPECFKDKESQDSKWEADDSSMMDTTTDAPAGIKQESDLQTDDDIEMTEVKKEVAEIKLDDGTEDTTTATIAEDGNVESSKDEPNVKTEVKQEEKSEETNSVAIKTEDIKEEKKEGGEEVKKEGKESCDEVTPKTEKSEDDKTEVKTETVEDMNTTVNLDSADDLHPTPISAPQPKVDIKVSLTSTTKQEVERQESSASTDTEQSEFDKEAIVGKALTKEQLDAHKPKLVGKTFKDIPMSDKDKGISGLCSIM